MLCFQAHQVGRRADAPVEEGVDLPVPDRGIGSVPAANPDMEGEPPDFQPFDKPHRRREKSGKQVF